MSELERRYRTLWTPEMWHAYCGGNAWRSYRLGNHGGRAVELPEPEAQTALVAGANIMLAGFVTTLLADSG